MPKQCFVIGPIGEAGGQIRAAADAFMKYIVEPTLANSDYIAPVLRADTLGEPGRITSQIIKLLRETDLVIADLTRNNPNVFYELSLRHAIGKPAIHMAEQGTILPFDLHDNRTIFYTMDIRDVEAACAELARQIGVVSAEGYKASNPITEAISVIELSRSHDPTQQTLSTVVQSVEALAAEVRRLSAAQPTTTYLVPPLFNNRSTILTGALTGGRTVLGAVAANLTAAETSDTPLAAAIADKAAEPGAEAEQAGKPNDKG